LSETWHRVSPSPNARAGLLDMIRRGALAFPFAVAPSLVRVAEILQKYAELPTSIADATLLLMAEEMPRATIWSTDRDFLLHRTKDRRRVKAILPL
jgi:predicted nucleic acid-binding protein